MKKLYEEAKSVMKHSYSTYSNFKVGAAVELKDGRIITGTNIELAAYGSTMCAERSALFYTYSQGYRKNDIVSILLTSEKSDFISPCGACRQVIYELMNKDALVHMTNNIGEIKTVTVKELLPFGFDEDDLHV